jgi:hypothetical protein
MLKTLNLPANFDGDGISNLDDAPKVDIVIDGTYQIKNLNLSD